MHGVRDVTAVRLRWIGHRLYAEADLVVDADLSLVAAHEIAADAEHQLTHAVPRLTTATVHTDPDSHPGAHHHPDLSHQRRNQAPPVFEQASEKHQDIVFGKVDTEAEQSLAAAAQIRSIPTLMAFRDGVLVFSQPGALPARALEQVIHMVRDLDMDEVRAKISGEPASR